MRKFAVIAALGCGLIAPAMAQTAGPRVATVSGPVVGVEETGVRSFRGIPYASPPVGDLRWTPPKAVAAWKTDFDATRFGPACMQYQPPNEALQPARGPLMSEDCLTLNVWTPASAKNAPVIVWLHGGGHVSGSGAGRFENGQAFARDGVMIVNVNYRLGALGYFAQASLGKDANFGLLDQIAALKWVKANAGAFGGDPANVTVMGESSGGEDVLALMTSPMAKGLFTKAIAESPGGAWWAPVNKDEAQKRALAVAQKAGLTGAADAKALRALPADKLASEGGRGGMDLVLDGQSLTEGVMDAFAAGHAAAIPLLIGTNSGEGSLLGDSPKPEDVFDDLKAEDVAKLKAIYGVDGVPLARMMFRDGFFAGPVLYAAQQQEKAGRDVYLYRFDFRMSVLRSRRPDAYHGSELPFVFDTLPPQAAGLDDSIVRNAVHGCWVEFAKTGAPTCDWAPGWAKGTKTWMVFDDGPGDRPIGSTEAIDMLRSKLTAGR